MRSEKYALLKYNTSNLGDEIQSIAAKQFLPEIDYFVDRDNINRSIIKRKTKLILNGWFTHNPENWPIKNKNICPLFISFHISDKYGSSIKKLTNSESVKYYKAHEPIGCRDIHTLQLLKNKGVDAYFSGCLTLTLKNKFKKRTNKIYIVDVDPYIKKIIPSDVKKDVFFLSHQCNKRMFRFWRAQRLLDKYAQAKLVITSKLHCAMPCLALGTPVIFINNNLEDPRFGGLINLLRCFSLEDLKNNKIPLEWYNPKPNPTNISSIRNALMKRCTQFIDETEKIQYK